MPFRALLPLLAAAALAGAGRAATDYLAAYERVTIAPTKTSIYIGTVAMTMPTFHRADGRYTAPYTAKVFPYFFYNEQGHLAIEMSDEQLRRLERGETVEFQGRARNESAEERRVEGRATPIDTTTGKLKVRVFVSRRVELIFNTTYRFEPAPRASLGATPPSLLPP